MEEMSYKPVSHETKRRLIESMLLTLESSYKEMYVDMVLEMALQQRLFDGIENLDKEYVGQLIRVHANVAYANLCLCVQCRASLRAMLNVEKQYQIRRSVVTAHEMYKYLYGFTGRSTPWLGIETRVRSLYADKCDEIAAAATNYLNKYAQETDGTLRDVAKHFSNNPVEFFDSMEQVDERGVSDRIAAYLAFAQPIHMLLTNELKSALGVFCDIAYLYPMPVQNIELISERSCEKIKELNEGILRYGGIVQSVIAQKEVAEKVDEKFNLDMNANPQWTRFFGDNVGLHILYIYLDAMTTFKAFETSETFAEYRQNLAYLILLSHEGFKKLYGFDETKREGTFWNRSIKKFVTQNGDEALREEAERIERNLNILAGSALLRDEDMVVTFTHVGTIKKQNRESAFAVLDYFRQPVTKADLDPLIDFLHVMNDIVRLYTQVLGLENEQVKQETEAKFEGYMRKLDEMDRIVTENTKDPSVLAKWKENFEKLRGLIKMINDKIK